MNERSINVFLCKVYRALGSSFGSRATLNSDSSPSGLGFSNLERCTSGSFVDATGLLGITANPLPEYISRTGCAKSELYAIAHHTTGHNLDFTYGARLSSHFCHTSSPPTKSREAQRLPQEVKTKFSCQRRTFAFQFRLQKQVRHPPFDTTDLDKPHAQNFSNGFSGFTHVGYG